jgi:hypothetical protein
MIRYNDLQIGVQILAEAILIPGAAPRIPSEPLA